MSPMIELREVGLRDGLQLVGRYPETAQKQRWLGAAHEAGVRHFEVGSYLPARTAPQFADIDALVATVGRLPGARCAVLALNDRGLQNAIAGDAHDIGMVISATEAHSQRNMRRSRDQAIELVVRAVALNRETGAGKRIVAGVAMAFGCSIAGQVAPAEVLRLAERLIEAGADAISIADTVGYAGPRQVHSLVTAIGRLAGGRPLGIHLHDTRGLGLANAAAAIEAGATLIDAATGGLGGCPFAPGASGNIVFEDLVFLCQTMGLATGIDIERLVAARALLAEAMPEEPMFGAIARTELPIGHHQM
ncbi:MAG: hydroxymethylglutaryl-CoA lyase [Burkholderiaceae bacterium]|nr:hydroxymethylglutaryl-CoA lyase [Burkholderiaceae bacterium]